MHPVLVRVVGGIPLHSYGVCLVIALGLALGAIAFAGRTLPKLRDDAIVVATIAAGVAMGGARLAFIVVNWRDYFVEHVVDERTGIPTVLEIWKGGLVLWGALLSVVVVFVVYAIGTRKKWFEALAIADVAVVALPVAQGIGRLGCFSAGCCWGRRSDSFGVSFPDVSLAYQSLLTTVDVDVANAMRESHETLPLIPVQLIETVCDLALFVALVVVLRRKPFHGAVVVAYGAIYGALWIAYEAMRDDHQLAFAPISLAQIIAAVLCIVSIVASVMLRSRREVAVNAG